MTAARHIPFDEINAAALASFRSLVEEWLPGGRLEGSEYKCGDLQGGKGRSVSINVNTGAWAEFAGDARGGDPISLHAAIFHRGDRVAAAKDLGALLGVTDQAPPPRRTGVVVDLPRKSVPPTDEPVMPAPTEPPETFRAKAGGSSSRMWVYRDAEGRPLMADYRWDLEGGGKDIRSATHDGKAWRLKAKPTDRPLYGLDRLAAMPKDVVIVCEGCKSADAAQALLPNNPCVSWPGGSNAVAKADWAPLHGRLVIVWPDADKPGAKAAARIVELLDGKAEKVRVMRVDDLGTEGEDAADVDWTPENALAELKARLQPTESTSEPPPAEYYGPATPDDVDRAPSAADEPPAPAIPPSDIPGAPVPLGYDRGTYFYLASGSRQVVGLSAAQHNKAGLMALAGLAHYWERTMFRDKKGVKWDEASDWLMRACEAVGVFDPARLRGRGAWLDGDRSVVHLGDRLIVDGVETPIGAVEGSRAVYETAIPMMRTIGAPLSNAEAHRLVDICNELRWEKGAHGLLLAGWVAIAPICGALRWRPSIWLTGPSGSGKTYVLEDIIRRALGQIALAVQSKTSEAGLRQTLRSDARPVIFDEAEQEDLQARQRMQGTLDLVRQSSSEAGAEIVKGTQSQTEAKRYRIRSCFAFCSINVGIEQYADETRITVMPLQGIDRTDPEAAAQADEQFERLQSMVVDTLTDEFHARLIARSVSLMQVIRRNAETFSRAVALHLGSRRLGDQLGALLAGAYSLHSTGEISMQAAKEWIGERDWEGSTAAEAESDEARLVSFILQATQRVTSADGKALDLSVGELVDACRPSMHPSAKVQPQEADQALRRIGVRYDHSDAPDGSGRPGVWISDTYNPLKRILSGTPWASRWGLALSRVRGAVKPRKTVRFGKGQSTRATWIPLEVLFEENQ